MSCDLCTSAPVWHCRPSYPRSPGNEVDKGLQLLLPAGKSKRGKSKQESHISKQTNDLYLKNKPIISIPPNQFKFHPWPLFAPPIPLSLLCPPESHTAAPPRAARAARRAVRRRGRRRPCGARAPRRGGFAPGRRAAQNSKPSLGPKKWMVFF